MLDIGSELQGLTALQHKLWDGAMAYLLYYYPLTPEQEKVYQSLIDATDSVGQKIREAEKYRSGPCGTYMCYTCMCYTCLYQEECNYCKDCIQCDHIVHDLESCTKYERKRGELL